MSCGFRFVSYEHRCHEVCRITKNACERCLYSMRTDAFREDSAVLSREGEAPGHVAMSSQEAFKSRDLTSLMLLGANVWIPC